MLLVCNSEIDRIFEAFSTRQTNVFKKTLRMRLTQNDSDHVTDNLKIHVDNKY